MRISDWSSDVCSSDLAEIVAHRLAELRLQGRVVEHVVDELEGDAEAAAEALQRRLLRGRPVGHHGADAAGGGEQRGGLRSEEHTSELQSLMRISYAVFCLKKKKKPHKPTDHHTKAETSGTQRWSTA